MNDDKIFNAIIIMGIIFSIYFIFQDELKCSFRGETRLDHYVDDIDTIDRLIGSLENRKKMIQEQSNFSDSYYRRRYYDEDRDNGYLAHNTKYKRDPMDIEYNKRMMMRRGEYDKYLPPPNERGEYGGDLSEGDRRTQGFKNGEYINDGEY